MKRMGWKEGKGLGKNEDGAPDFIRVKKKVNTKGIGFNGVDDRWIEHQEAFDSLLSNLNDGKPAANEDKLISVEERALKLGGRVHYSKFLRGKDLSKKKEEDLNAIVVKRRKKKDSEKVQEVDVPSHEDLSGVKTHTSSMSYQEYFAQRMKASKRRKGLNEDVEPQACHHSSDTINCSGDEHSGMTSGKKHKTYEKNALAQDDWTCNADENVFGAGIPPSGTSTKDACSMEDSYVEAKKKSKKSKHKSFDHAEIHLSNIGAERRDDRLKDAAEVVAMPKEHYWEEGISERRKKRRHTDDVEQTLHEATESHTEFYPEDSVPQRVKKGSKRKCCDGGEDQGFETVASTKKKKKPNHQSAHNAEEDQPETESKAAAVNFKDRAAEVESSVPPSELCFQEEAQKQAKKKKLKGSSLALDEMGELKVKSEFVNDTAKRCSSLLHTSSLATGQSGTVLKQAGKLKGNMNCDLTDQADEQIKRGDHMKDVKDKSTASATNTGNFELRRSERKREGKERKAADELDVKAKARKGSSELQEVQVALKKYKQESEHTESFEVETKKDYKQKKQTVASSPEKLDSEQEVKEAKTQISTKTKGKPKQKVTPDKSNLKQENVAPNSQANKVSRGKKEVISKGPTPEQEYRPEVKAKKVSKQKQTEEAKSSTAIPKQQGNQKGKGKNQPKQNRDHMEEAPVETKTMPKQNPKRVMPVKTNPEQKAKRHTMGKGQPKRGEEDAKKPEGATAKSLATKPAITSTKPRAKTHAQAAGKFVAKKLVELRQGARNNARRCTLKPEMQIPEATHPTRLPGHCQRNAKARNDAMSHCEGRLELSNALHLDKCDRGIWSNLFAPNIILQPVHDKIAALMAQWVVDTVENSGVRVTPAKACHLSKEAFARMLTDHIYRQHRRTNWMHIPGYGSRTWVQGVVSFLADRMMLKCSKKA